MRVSDERRVLFVHVPKNGGSSVDWTFDHEVPDGRRVLDRGRHSTYGQLLRTEPPLLDYWAFGFVRNPWARMVSWFSMMRNIFANEAAGVPRTLDKLTRKPDVWEPVRPFVGDFETFVLEGTRQIPRFSKPQLDWLETADGRRVDFVGRVENYHADFAVARERLGLPPVEKAPKRNRTSHEHYSTYYTDETRDRVAELFASDIEEFGYTFEPG
jgi:hypothetical protein